MSVKSIVGKIEALNVKYIVEIIVGKIAALRVGLIVGQIVAQFWVDFRT